MLGYDFYILLWETLPIFVVTLYLRTKSFTFCVLFKSTKVEKQLLTLCYASISISKHVELKWRQWIFYQYWYFVEVTLGSVCILSTFITYFKTNSSLSVKAILYFFNLLHAFAYDLGRRNFIHMYICTNKMILQMK